MKAYRNVNISDLPGYSGANWLLDVLTDPPIILLFKITHRDNPGSATNRKLSLWKNQYISG